MFDYKPTLLMMIGEPGSGKTTLGRKLITTLSSNAYYASTDHIIDAYAIKHNKNYNEVFAARIKQATLAVEDAVRNAIRNSQDILWDQTNLTKNTRKKKLDLFDSSYKKIAVNMMFPFNLQERLDSRPWKIIPTGVIKQMEASYQPPSLDEGFDELWFYEDDKRIS